MKWMNLHKDKNLNTNLVKSLKEELKLVVLI